MSADQRPAAVALPGSAAEVAGAVRLARREGLRIAPQGTGHSAAPMGDLGDTLLLRTDRLRGVAIDPDARRARAEAGVLWDDVVPPASGMGLSALHGSAPDIGVVGYSLGGGIGWQARSRGLATNSVTAVELVTADGEHVRADHDHEADLFWALRGGGGNFGVVTAIEFALYPLHDALAGWLVWPWERADEVLRHWARWAAEAPEEVTSVGRLLRFPPIDAIPEPFRGRDLVAVEAVHVGDADRDEDLLRPLRALAPEMDTFARVPPLALTRLHMDPEDPVPFMGDHALLDDFGDDAVDAFLAVAGPGSGSPLLSVEMRHLGGALRRRSPGAGALSHVDAGWISFSAGLVTGPEAAIALDAHLRRVTAALAPFGHGRAYLNFAMAPADPASFFEETVLQRLRRIRAAVDPAGVLRANHPIPAA